MSMQPGQFGIFGLFVITTFAASALAIIRLPLPLVAKICMVQAIAVCFIGWALRNHKYPHPAEVKPRPLLAAISSFAAPLIILPSVVQRLWWYSPAGSRTVWALEVALLAFFLVYFAIGIVRAVRAYRSLRVPPESPRAID
jgi:hypothetical protein